MNDQDKSVTVSTRVSDPGRHEESYLIPAKAKQVEQIGTIGISLTPFSVGRRTSMIFVNTIDDRVMVADYLFTQEEALKLAALIRLAVGTEIDRKPTVQDADIPMRIGRLKIERDERTEALSGRLPQHIFTRIHCDMGTASMCWEKVDQAGVFDSDAAGALAFNLCHFIADELQKVRDTFRAGASPSVEPAGETWRDRAMSKPML